MHPQRREYIRPLTGLRGVTILSVVLAHYGGCLLALLPGLTWLVLPFTRVAFRMQLLFVLSGFITAHIFINKDELLTFPKYWRFVRGRLVRLYPAYLAAFLVLAGGVVIGRLLGLRVQGDYPLEAVPIHLALLQAWPFASWCTFAWNYPMWFLSALWFAYLFVFPCSWWLVRRLRGSPLTLAGLYGLHVLAMIIPLIIADMEFHMVVWASFRFAVGSMLYVLYLNRARFIVAAQRHLDLTVLGYLALLMLGAHSPSLTLSQWVNYVLVLGLPVLVAGLTAETSVSARLLTSRPLMWLAGISYAMFVSHGVVLKVLEATVPARHYMHSPLVVRCVLLLGYVAAVLGAATALHKWVETPSRRVLEQWLVRRRERSKGGAAGALPVPINRTTRATPPTIS